MRETLRAVVISDINAAALSPDTTAADKISARWSGGGAAVYIAPCCELVFVVRDMATRWFLALERAQQQWDVRAVAAFADSGESRLHTRLAFR